ncbi:LysR family transcriptional regulator [Niallia sp. Krafla_26]|uniref:LysR family transcriptional regulator n=1 Tax=Niallia sp. Krafla_26 TaxID=3064703 RepID=UPI003D16FD56
MNINQLQYFCVLAETEHYTRAAKLLSITQPSLTHSIKELEKELGVTLFNKHGRNIKINQFGEFLYQQVGPILDSLEKTKNDIQLMVDPTRGTIHLSFLHSLSQDFIPKVINQFVQSEENKHIHFVLDQGTTTDIKKDFFENKIDIAFTSFIEEDEITSIPILNQELYLATSLDHPLSNKTEIDLVETADYPFIFYNEKSSLRPIIDDLFKQINIAPKITYELADDGTVCGFVAANLGIAIVPNIFGIQHFPIKLIKIKNPFYERKIYLSFNGNKYMSPPVCKFKDFILKKLSIFDEK